MKRAIALPLALLAACGGEEEAARPGTNAADIARLAAPKVEKADPLASARLQPLAPEEIALEGLAGPGCGFRVGGRTLLRAVGSDALVRLDGELRHLIHSAPVGPTGGFFEDRQLSVSVGRTESEAGALGAAKAGSWPARLTVTNRRTETEVELRGTWSCSV